MQPACIDPDTVESEVRALDGGAPAPWYSVAVAHRGGARVEVAVVPTAARRDEVYELYGEGCASRVALHDFTRCEVRCREGGALGVDEVTTDAPPHVVGGSYHETAAFPRALGGDGPFGPTVEEAMPGHGIYARLAPPGPGAPAGCVP